MRQSKYHNKRTVLDGFAFDSQAEAKRYGELKLLERAGKASGVEVHPRFPLTVNGVHICTYEADFRYVDVLRGTIVVEDVKGYRTALYGIKKKLLKACHGIEILEVEA